MQILLNGNPHIFDGTFTIYDLLLSLRIPKEGTAIALNNSIIPQSEFESRCLNENDKVEIIRAVGGG